MEAENTVVIRATKKKGMLTSRDIKIHANTYVYRLLEIMKMCFPFYQT